MVKLGRVKLIKLRRNGRLIYQWKTIKYPIPAQTAGEEVERIASIRPLTPEVIINESKAKESPLHPIFEWNNEKAGHEWRKQQARVMLGNLVTVSVCDSTVEPTRAFVSITNEEQYTSIEVVVNNENLLNQVLLSALNELNSFKKKYHNLKALEKVFTAIEDILLEKAV